MPKVRWTFPSTTDPLHDSDPTRQKQLCIETIDLAWVPLLNNFRTGAGDLRQKYAKRLQLAKKGKARKLVTSLENELHVLNTLDFHKVADQHLRTTIGYTNGLKDVESLQDYINGCGSWDDLGDWESAADLEVAISIVTTRLGKVHSVKRIVNLIIERLRHIVGAPRIVDEEEKAEEDQQATNKKHHNEEEEVSGEDEDYKYTAFEARIAVSSSGEEDNEGSLAGSDRPSSVGKSENELLEGGLESNDECSSEDELEDAEVSHEGAGSVLYKEASTPQPQYSDESSSDLSFASFSDSDEPALPKITPKSKSKATAPHATTSSAFLPALSYGGYLPGSESEASDLDMNNAPKKNRRGQRARQKIAEAKYGTRAKHLQKAQRNEGWDPRRGAVDNVQVGSSRRNEGRNSYTRQGRGVQQSGSNAEPLGKRKREEGNRRDDKGQLHPSWQAAKAAKESKKLKIDVKGTTSGKKVVFD